jgi:hypothetical protein
MTSPRTLDVRRLTIASTLRGIIVTMLPDGGQRTARRNAWEAVCADRVRARGRQEAWHELDRTRAGLEPVVRSHSGIHPHSSSA